MVGATENRRLCEHASELNAAVSKVAGGPDEQGRGARLRSTVNRGQPSIEVTDSELTSAHHEQRHVLPRGDLGGGHSSVHERALKTVGIRLIRQPIISEGPVIEQLSGRVIWGTVDPFHSQTALTFAKLR